MTKLYAVYDNVAQTITGPIMTFKADAAAIRMFSELLADNRTDLAKHPADYRLVYLGYIHGDDVTELKIVASLGAEMIISGEQWLAMQEKSTGA